MVEDRWPGEGGAEGRGRGRGSGPRPRAPLPERVPPPPEARDRPRALLALTPVHRDTCRFPGRDWLRMAPGPDPGPLFEPLL